MLGHERRSKILAKLTNAWCELEDALHLSIPAARYDPVVIPVTFPSLLKKRSSRSRLDELRTVLHLAKVRMPDKKASWLADAFERIRSAGGPIRIKKDLLTRDGREGKISFWR